jgi:transcriptional regulator with XRE-family HTH domain
MDRYEDKAIVAQIGAWKERLQHNKTQSLQIAEEPRCKQSTLNQIENGEAISMLSLFNNEDIRYLHLSKL